MDDGMITVKEYADRRNKSVQAVYKQMRSTQNASALDGHIFTRRISNKNVKCLDAEAIRILDNASNHSVQVVVQAGDKERIAQLEEEKQALIIKIAELQSALLDEREAVKQLQADKIALLEEKASQEAVRRPWWRFWHE